MLFGKLIWIILSLRRQEFEYQVIRIKGKTTSNLEKNLEKNKHLDTKVTKSLGKSEDTQRLIRSRNRRGTDNAMAKETEQKEKQ
jgi:hypothetical protein